MSAPASKSVLIMSFENVFGPSDVTCFTPFLNGRTYVTPFTADGASDSVTIDSRCAGRRTPVKALAWRAQRVRTSSVERYIIVDGARNVDNRRAARVRVFRRRAGTYISIVLRLGRTSQAKVNSRANWAVMQGQIAARFGGPEPMVTVGGGAGPTIGVEPLTQP